MNYLIYRVRGNIKVITTNKLKLFKLKTAHYLINVSPRTDSRLNQLYLIYLISQISGIFLF